MKQRRHVPWKHRTARVIDHRTAQIFRSSLAQWQQWLTQLPPSFWMLWWTQQTKLSFHRCSQYSVVLTHQKVYFAVERPPITSVRRNAAGTRSCAHALAGSRPKFANPTKNTSTSRPTLISNVSKFDLTLHLVWFQDDSQVFHWMEWNCIMQEQRKLPPPISSLHPLSCVWYPDCATLHDYCSL